MLTLTSVRILSSTKDFDLGQKEQLVRSGFQTGTVVTHAGHFVDELQHAFQVRGKLVQQCCHCGGTHSGTTPAIHIGIGAVHRVGGFQAVNQLEGNTRLGATAICGGQSIMVKADDLCRIGHAVDCNVLLVTDLPVVRSLTELGNSGDVVPRGSFQRSANYKGIDIHDTDDFQRVNLGFLRTVVSKHDSPVTQLGRVQSGIAGRSNLAGQSFTAPAHGDGRAYISDDTHLGGRTLLAQSIQSVIHRGVAAAQFQCRLGGVGQHICLGQCGADHITACGVQTNVEGSGSGEKLCAPFLEGCRHIGRSLDRPGLTVALDDSIFHEISSLLSAVIQTNIGESVHRAVDLGIQLGFHLGQRCVDDIQEIFNVVYRGKSEIVQTARNQRCV